MPIPELYHPHRKMPEERVARNRNFSWLLLGLNQSRSYLLSKVAKKTGTAYLPSTTQRKVLKQRDQWHWWNLHHPRKLTPSD